MKNIVVIGAGKIGSTIARLLAHSGDYHVTLADRSTEQLAMIEMHDAITTAEIDIADGNALVGLLSGKFAVLSAAPFHLTIAIAEAASKAGVHYLDLTEDVESTRRVKAIAETANRLYPAVWPGAWLHLDRRQ
jgi:saccharopine dehydrogenase-like NADP-dependent oxidoreductase